MFTRKQIEEIAAKLAAMSIKDSQFSGINYPFNGSESVPILQSGANKRVSFAEMMNIIMGNEANLNIQCVLTVQCPTEGATVKINGNTTNTYTGYYGQIVDVEITADKHDTWYGAITLTQNHTLSVSLNETGSSVEPIVSTYTVQVFNNQGATIRIAANGGNLIQVSSGEIKTFSAGTTIDIVVTKTGYYQGGMSLVLNSNFSTTINLVQEPENPDVDNVLYFDSISPTSPYSLSLSSEGDSKSVKIVANVPWEVYSQDKVMLTGNPETDPEVNPDTESRASTQTPTEFKYDNEFRVGDSWTMEGRAENGWSYSILQGNSNIISIDGDVLTATNEGSTYIVGVKRENGFVVDYVLIKYNILPPASGGDVPVERVELHRNILQFTTDWYYIEKLYATVYPSNAVSHDVIWESSDTDVATVSYSGGNSTVCVVTANRRIEGSCVITAKSSVDNSKIATCRVIITAEGTVVNDVSPKSINSPSSGNSTNVSLVTDTIGNRSSGWLVYGPYKGDGSTKESYGQTVYVIENSTNSDGTQKNGFTLRTLENIGSKRTFSLILVGRDNGGKDGPESSRTITIVQDYNKKASALPYGDSRTFSSNAADAQLLFNCALGYGREIATNDVQVVDSISTNNPISWITIKPASTVLDGVVGNTTLTKDQLRQIDSQAEKTLNGEAISITGYSNMDTSGRTGRYGLSYSIEANTGTTRTGVIIVGGLAFTVTQEAE